MTFSWGRCSAGSGLSRLGIQRCSASFQEAGGMQIVQSNALWFCTRAQSEAAVTGSGTSAPAAPQAVRASSCFGSAVLCRQPEQDWSSELAAAGRWQRCPEAASAHSSYLHPTQPQRAPAAACSLNNRTRRLGTASVLPQSLSGPLEAALLLAASAMRSLPPLTDS